MGANLHDIGDELYAAALALYNAASAAGLQPRITSVLRSYAEQKRLYRSFLAGQAGFPVLPPGYSAHEDRGDGTCDAFDMVVTPMDALADVGYTWQQWGGGWNPKDAIHFEAPGASDAAWARGLANFGDPAKLDFQSAVAKAADRFDALPWYAKLALPQALGTTPSHESQIDQKLCEWFGFACGK